MEVHTPSGTAHASLRNYAVKALDALETEILDNLKNVSDIRGSPNCQAALATAVGVLHEKAERPSFFLCYGGDQRGTCEHSGYSPATTFEFHRYSLAFSIHAFVELLLELSFSDLCESTVHKQLDSGNKATVV